MKERTKRGRNEDRDRIAANQKWEMEYMRNKYHVTDEQIKNAIATVGNDRDRVEAFLKERSSDHVHQPGNIDKSGKEDLQNMEANQDTHAISNTGDKISGLHQLQKKEDEGQVQKEISEDKQE